MLWILPLERLEERYTTQWYAWFKRELDARKVDYTFVDGSNLTRRVTRGRVLDIEGTNYWKLTQLQAIVGAFKNDCVKNGDKFFTMDLWHPGLEVIPYMAQLEGIDVEIYGFLHAGSYTKGDFAEPLAYWARSFEQGWLAFCSKVFVASYFHKQDVLRSRGEFCTLVVTGNPFDTFEVRRMAGLLRSAAERENIIVFPHRWDTEKRPDLFMEIMSKLWKEKPDFQVLITNGGRCDFRSNDQSLIEQLKRCDFPYEICYGLSKREYYQRLGTAKVFVSTAEAEYFGYCFVESMALGCATVVPEALCYPEMLDCDQTFLYTGVEDAVNKIRRQLEAPQSAEKYALRYDGAVAKILDEMGV